MLGFLKTFGKVVLKGIAIINGFAPTAKALIPGDKDDRIIDIVSQDLAQIADIITTTEAIGQTLNLPGTQKLDAAAPLVAQVILKSAVLANHQIANPSLFSQGARKIADGFADVLNSLHPAGVVTMDKTNLTPAA